MPKSHLPYPAEFRQQIIELADAGRTPVELSKEFGPTGGVPPSGVRAEVPGFAG